MRLRRGRWVAAWGQVSTHLSQRRRAQPLPSPLPLLLLPPPPHLLLLPQTRWHRRAKPSRHASRPSRQPEPG